MDFSYVLVLIGALSYILIVGGAVCLVVLDNKKIGVLLGAFLIAFGGYLLMVTKGLI